ncbi:hypothetical protein F2Q70_00036022 [Brassica cretica]|uniref:Uncharacterized protein n=1 Tax=Brassica cretica TaxID=69181 RepID=A0A8S9JRW9_BRACR|nr:hypothetical protein F2Q70_00036022 [Brassica cretica]
MLLSWVLSKDEALLRLVGLGGHCRDLVSSLEQNLADVKQKLLLKLLTESERNFIASYETDDEMMSLMKMSCRAYAMIRQPVSRDGA